VPGTRGTIRWGILGCGRIAGLFAEGLQAVPDAELVAVGSRSTENAEAFGEKYGVARRHASYEALAADPDVDLVYVATPHQLHRESTLLCLNNGKGVLCEKPFAINSAETAEMIATAREKNLFLMEAMWTRFSPVMTAVRDLIASGAIGEVRMVSADFGFRATPPNPHRLFDPAYGGGALMDVGVYVTSFASMILGTPNRVVSQLTVGEQGVDEQAAFILGYESGALAILSAAIRTSTPQVATVMGTEGRIDIHSLWWRPTRFTLVNPGKDPIHFEPERTGNGYNYEAIEAGRCLREELTESPVMPLEETAAIIATLDEIRRQAGIVFPMESYASC
jgi:predicted dehydrogenase